MATAPHPVSQRAERIRGIFPMPLRLKLGGKDCEHLGFTVNSGKAMSAASEFNLAIGNSDLYTKSLTARFFLTPF